MLEVIQNQVCVPLWACIFYCTNCSFKNNHLLCMVCGAFISRSLSNQPYMRPNSDNCSQTKVGVGETVLLPGHWLSEKLKCTVSEHCDNEMCSVTESCPTLCDPRDSSPAGSSVHGISQARILGWVAIPSSRGSFRPDPGIKFMSPALSGGFTLSHLEAQ